MLNAQEIREKLVAKNFLPFAVHMSDGSRYEIANHDQVLVSRNAIEIAVDPDALGIAARFVRCAIIHITRLEELQAA